jgi:6-phosphofructokinase 1
MKIGFLTGGGDCPGLNGVLRAAVKQAISGYGDECVGFLDGWRGPLESDTIPLTLTEVRDILPLGGTILGTSRTNAGTPERVAQVVENLRALGIDALIPIGGEDTLGVATKLAEAGVRCVGVPKTIDNDLSGTDVTFGFDTAVQIATDAIDRLLTTSASHHRALVVEVMGRHAGWIALQAGLAGGAAATLIPEVPFDVADVAARVSKLVAARRPAVVVVAEGAVPTSTVEGSERILDEFGHVAIGGIAEYLADQIGKLSGVETRTAVLGHTQRGGTPSAFDRVLSTRLGIAAVDALHRGESGVMVAIRSEEIHTVSLADATGTLRTVPESLYRALDAMSAWA